MRWIRSIAGDVLGVALVIGSLTLTGGTISSPFRCTGRSASKSSSTPNIMLWAWERPTELKFIDSKKVGVAFLARSIRIESDRVMVKPRLQPLSLPASTTVTAVARIETAQKQRPLLSQTQIDETARAVLEMAAIPRVSALQIDFDVTRSERDFYRSLLRKVRAGLPPGTRLSITALASWCMDDDWIADLPVDEAVPMLFRMAADGKHIADRLDNGDDFREPLCRSSYGISLDERRPQLLNSRRLYIFNPDAWTEDSVRKISESNK